MAVPARKNCNHEQSFPWWCRFLRNFFREKEGITTFHRGYEPDGRWILLDFPVMAFGEKDRLAQGGL